MRAALELASVLVIALGAVFVALGLFLGVVEGLMGSMVFLILGVATIVVGRAFIPKGSV